jgi:tripartite-type tricarboxylate transporter receptor subunit TctC
MSWCIDLPIGRRASMQHAKSDVPRRAALVVLILGPIALAHAPAVYAQAFPNKPLRIIVPFAPGGGSDTLARLIGDRLGEALGQPVVVDNKPGGSTIVGTVALANAPPDGHTLGLLSPPFVFNPFVTKSLPYDSDKDFAPVALIGVVPNVLTSHPALPAKTVAELVALAKAKPGQLSYAYSPLTSGHLSMELLKKEAGVDIEGVPYKGGGQAVNDLLGGQVQLMINSPINMLPHIRSGAVRALATTSVRRSQRLPDVPTVAESGFPDYDTYEWYGLLAPANTPREVAGRLNAEIAKILGDPAVEERLAELATEPRPLTPEAFGAFIDAERAKWAPIARNIQFKLE